jgi:hypothetical protein
MASGVPLHGVETKIFVTVFSRKFCLSRKKSIKSKTICDNFNKKENFPRNEITRNFVFSHSQEFQSDKTKRKNYYSKLFFILLLWEICHVIGTLRCVMLYRLGAGAGDCIFFVTERRSRIGINTKHCKRKHLQKRRHHVLKPHSDVFYRGGIWCGGACPTTRIPVPFMSSIIEQHIDSLILCYGIWWRHHHGRLPIAGS